MNKKFYLALAGFVFVLVAVSTPAAENGKFRRANKPLFGRYTVIFEDSVGKSERRALAMQLAAAHRGEILYHYEAVLNGFAIQLPEAAAIALSRNPHVQYVEEDYALTVDSSHPTSQAASFYGIDRIDQPFGVSESYTYVRRGSGVHVYVLDTGIRTTHKEFGTRANAFRDFFPGQFMPNHGTFVAGVIGAKNFGVAKNVQLYSVRVCDANSQCPATTIAAGLDAVVLSGNRPAVVNMSLSNPTSAVANVPSMENAIQRAIDAGVTCVAGAGNGSTNVSAYTPARMANLITVAATDRSDNRPSYSNFGSGVDLFAPGGVSPNQFIPVPAASSDTDTDGFTGTSAAAPHVSGIAALYLEANPSATHFQVRDAIVANATANAVPNPSGSPNLLAYSGFIPPHPTNPIESDEFYVRQQYLDFLRRVANSAELASRMNLFGPCQNWFCRVGVRIDILRSIMESPEFRSNKPALQNPGTADYNREFVRQLYLGALQRDPDQAGWDQWTNVLNQTGDFAQVIGAFISPPEYWLRFGEQSQPTPVNDAEFVSQSGVPSSMRPSDRVEVTVIMRNVGTTTWTSAEHYRLGSQSPQNNLTWLWISTRVELPSTVPPGGQATIKFLISAPSTPGTYDFQWRMVRDREEVNAEDWFGAFTPKLTISVSGNPLPWLSSFSYGFGPIAAGSDGFDITLNGGLFVPNSVVRVDGVDRPITSINETRTTLTSKIHAADVATVGTHRVTVFNPAPGGGESGAVIFDVVAPINDASFVSQQFVPSTTIVGQVAAVEVTMRNTGTTTWTAGRNYALGSQNPSDNVTWGSSRVALPVSVPPSWQVTFRFNITAPSTPNTYKFQWRMVQDGVEWFGASTTETNITVSNPAPKLSTISPSSVVAGSPDFDLTVTGKFFVPTSVVRFNGSNRTTTFVSPTQLKARILSADTSAFGSITVFNPAPGGGTSASIELAVEMSQNATPTISNISPSSVQAGGAGFALTVNGNDFMSGSVVRFNGSNRTTTFVSPTQLTAQIAAADIAATNTYPITVFNPSPGGGTSGSASLTVTVPNNPVPTLSSIDPGSIAAGSANFVLTVDGSNFVSGAVVRINNSDRATTLVNANRLTAAVSAADVQVAGPVSVTVFNPAPGGGVSASTTLTVSNPMPTLTSIAPTSVQTGNTGPITVNGSNFVNGAVVRVNGVDRQTTFNSVTQLTVLLAAADVQAAGTRTITIFNPTPGGGSSAGAILTVFAPNPVPTISTLQPNNVTAGSGALTLTVTGGNFVAGSVVRVDGSDRPTTFSSPASLTAQIAATDVQTAGTRTITVFNPAPGGGVSGGATLTVAAPKSTYKASTDFSNVQGQNNWYYLDSNGAQLTYIAANGWWQGSDAYTILWSSGGHPNSTDAVRQWRAPSAGNVRITGNASDLDASQGDGVVVSIKKGTALLWQQTIANGGSASYDLTTSVVSGDQINFVINRGAAGSSAADATGFDPTISFVQVYRASTDFSSVQGQSNWYYLDSNGAQLTYVAANGWWRGADQFTLLWSSGGHPNSTDAVRQWRAPSAGSIRITGNASDADPSQGDGVMLSIKKGTAVLWQQTIANGGSTSYDVTTSVAAGDQIDFVINRGPAGNSAADSTSFDPTITLAPGAASAGTSEIVLWAKDAPQRVGNWSVVSDATAAGGARLSNADQGAAKLTTAVASPAHYFEMTFNATAGTGYRLWIRGRAQADSPFNDSAFVQFNDSVDSSGVAQYRIGTTASTEYNLEDCSGCTVQGWGWQDNAWPTGAAGALIYFPTTGTHTIRVQIREDGLSIDQIVLSPTTYLNSAPGPLKNDQTILQKSSG